MTIVENFGRLLKQFRQRNNMSREDFADRLGSNPSTIYSYEKSRRTPSIEFLRIMYDVFGVEPNYFFGIENENKEQDKDGIIQYLEQKIIKLTSSRDRDDLKDQLNGINCGTFVEHRMFGNGMISDESYFTEGGFSL